MLRSPDQVDKDGLPLLPQPSDDPEDPLNWPQKWKWFVLLQASTLAFLGVGPKPKDEGEPDRRS